VKLSKELETFLRKKGLLRKFKINITKYGAMDYFFTYINIGGAFVWNYTEEGWKFWNDTNNKFMNFQSKNKKSWQEKELKQ
jgi:hypothetical protein